jgi:DNA replication licensing factor MCM4
LKKNEFI